MTLKYIDGFEHYNAVGATNYIYTASPSRWSAAGADVSGSSCIATMPVLGGKCLNVAPRGSNQTIGRPLLLLPIAPASGLTFGCGFHFYATDLSYPSSPTFNRQAILGFSAGAAIVSKCIALDSAGQFSWRNTPEASSLGNSGANVISASVLYFIEIKILWHASAGTVEIRVNGAVYMSLTGIATLPTSATHMMFATAAFEGGGTSTAVWSYDDLFIWDALGSINNTFLGEQTVYTLFPSADTASADWAKSTGSNGYDLINDVPAVDATRYIEGTTVGNVSIFDLTDLPTTALTIAGVSTVIRSEKTDALAGTIDFGPKHGGTASLLSVAQANGQYQYYNKIDELNPSTSAAWTGTQINATQLQLSRTA